MKSILIIPAIAVLMIMSACNNDNQGRSDSEQHNEMDTNESEHKTTTMLPPHSMDVGGSTNDNLAGRQVIAQQVCMVNDTYMGKDQIAVPVNGKTYYGCCQMCVTTLNEQESSRQASDPLTGEEVDKAEAIIAVLNQDGSVGYFKNETNYQNYANKNE
ncbi:hypothetical protein [Lewinella cohaerens]|jgi:YHS domain-containing protein|uniref:hypothetical protein n=1 Tax=Lewinella cohaerens TaxID=70995 RepID=UPI000370CA3E|nr:hypothetical protein [Lewinella cohaerens]